MLSSRYFLREHKIIRVVPINRNVVEDYKVGTSANKNRNEKKERKNIIRAKFLRIDKTAIVIYNNCMNDYELSKLADLLDEDALRPDEIDVKRNPNKQDPKKFKEEYLEFYDDIKTTPRDDW